MIDVLGSKAVKPTGEVELNRVMQGYCQGERPTSSASVAAERDVTNRCNPYRTTEPQTASGVELLCCATKHSIGLRPPTYVRMWPTAGPQVAVF